MQDAYAKINNICLVILAMIGITCALIYTRTILVPFVFSVFIFAVASPGVKWLQTRCKLPRVVSVGVTFVLFLFLLGALLAFVSASLHGFFESAGIYKDKVLAFVDWSSQFVRSWGFQIDENVIRNSLSELPVFSFAKNVTGGAVVIVGNAMLVAVFVFFLLIGDAASGQRSAFLQEVFEKISQYIATKSIASLVTGFLVGLILGACGVPLAFMFAVLTVFLNFVPS